LLQGLIDRQRRLFLPSPSSGISRDRYTILLFYFPFLPSSRQANNVTLLVTINSGGAVLYARATRALIYLCVRACARSCMHKTINSQKRCVLHRCRSLALLEGITFFAVPIPFYLHSSYRKDEEGTTKTDSQIENVGQSITSNSRDLVNYSCQFSAVSIHDCIN